MSQAFIREGEGQWLNEIPPTVNALINFLTQENGGIRVYEKQNYRGDDGRMVHEMSNGLSYTKDSDNRWCVLQ